MSNPTARPSRYVATLVAACLAVMVAQVAYSLPGALNGTLPAGLQHLRRRTHVDQRRFCHDDGGFRTDLRRAR